MLTPILFASRRFHLYVSSVIALGCLFLVNVASAQTANTAKLLVLNKPQAKLLIVNPVAKKVIAEVPTGAGPHEVTASEDGKLAFVSNYGNETPGNSISVIDLAAHKELRRHELGALRRPHGIVASHGKVYCTAE